MNDDYSANVVTVVLPAGRFTGVARLVTAGFVAHSELGFEAVDDLQLAVEVVLRSLRPAGDRVTVRLTHGQEAFAAEIGSFDAQTLERDLADRSVQGIALSAFLARLVDAVEVVDTPATPKEEERRSIILHIRSAQSA